MANTKEDGIPVPESSLQITESWFKRISGFPILPGTFQLTSDVFSGAGCLSNVDRVQFELEPESGRITKSYIIKIPPRIKDAFTQSVYNVVTSEKLDQREVFFYQTLVPQITEKVPSLTEFIVPCMYAKVQTEPVHSSVLVFEDLRLLGYTMPTFATGLTSEQLDSAIDFLTKFHYAGHKLTAEKESLPEVYPILKDWHFPGESLQSFESLTWFHLGLPVVDRVLLNNSKRSSSEIEKMRSAYAKLIPHTYKIIEILATAGQKFPTLMHDDLWPNNFLVSEDGVGIKVLDWQLLAYSDPTYDLLILLLSCLPVAEINENKISELIKLYFRKYVELCGDQTPERNFEKFSEFFFTYGLVYAIAWFSMSCDSIECHSVNLEKLFTILEFLYEMKAIEFIVKSLEKFSTKIRHL